MEKEEFERIMDKLNENRKREIELLNELKDIVETFKD